MTVDDLRNEVKRDLEGISGKLDSLLTDMAAVKATQASDGDRRGTEIGALFEVREEHERRIAAVERDYTPRIRHDEVERRLTRLEGAFARYVGMAIAVVAVINFLGVGGIAALVYWGGR